MTGIHWKKEKTSKRFSFFFTVVGRCKLNHFESVQENIYPIVEDYVCLNNSIVEIDILDGKVIGEHIRWSFQNYGNTVCLLRYNVQKSHWTVIETVFRRSVARCFFNKTTKLLHHLTGCSKRVKVFSQKQIYRKRETLFDEPDSFGNEYANEQISLKNLAVLEFESNCLQVENFKDTDTRKWLKNYFPSSVSNSSNLVDRPSFL